MKVIIYFFILPLPKICGYMFLSFTWLPHPLSMYKSLKKFSDSETWCVCVCVWETLGALLTVFLEPAEVWFIYQISDLSRLAELLSCLWDTQVCVCVSVRAIFRFFHFMLRELVKNCMHINALLFDSVFTTTSDRPRSSRLWVSRGDGSTRPLRSWDFIMDISLSDWSDLFSSILCLCHRPDCLFRTVKLSEIKSFQKLLGLCCDSWKHSRGGVGGSVTELKDSVK